MSLQTNRVLLRQMAVEHQGGAEQYESFKKMMEASPLLYHTDYDVYTDEISERHLRNIAEINYLQTLIKQKKISPDMLRTNVYNTFYPSYVLHHHYFVFTPLLNKFKKEESVKEILIKAKNNRITGAFFHETRRLDMHEKGKETPTIDEKGHILMGKNVYFFSLVTSPYLTHAAFIVENPGGKSVAVAGIRNQEGQFASGVDARDLGGVVSKDYIPIGYNFNGIKPILLMPLSEKLIPAVESTPGQMQIEELSFSLKDFQKALWLAIKYTSMRKQFRTIQGSKDERRIITYQAVAARIINAFSQFQALSDLFSRAIQQPNAAQKYGELFKSAHHNILEHLIHLRECCGGFGYLQVAGHAGCIERVCHRAGREPQTHPYLSDNYLKSIQFYTGSQQVHKHFTLQITDKNISYIQFFSIFLSICKHLNSNSSKIPPLLFRRQFLRQTSIIAMHGREQFSRHDGENVHCKLLQYHILTYIHKNAAMINWDLVKISRSDFFTELQRQKSECFDKIVQNLQGLCSTLDLTYLRNTIVGRQNELEFYTEVVDSARKNKRNSKQYVDYIREPVIAMIQQNRARL